MANPHRRHWQLDPAITFLNHGSFGATPKVVLEKQSALRRQMELNPVRFFARELEPLLDDAREEVASFINAPPAGLVFVRNATEGVNAVLRSLQLKSGDELVTTDHAYNACRNTLEYVAGRAGATVRILAVPFPIRSPDQVLEVVEEALRRPARLLMIDHITSPTGLVFPVPEIIAIAKRAGVDVLVDGAHAPGMVPLDLANLGATYYAANLHKWVCAPKGSAFLWVDESRRAEVRPAIISHGANSRRKDRSRFQIEFDWTGTGDPTAILSAPDSLSFLEDLLPGGWPELMKCNRELALQAQNILSAALSVEPPAPPSMIGALAAVPIPDGAAGTIPPALFGDPLQDALLGRYGIEVPVVPWPGPPARLIRISAQLYNSADEYVTLAGALGELLDERL